MKTCENGHQFYKSSDCESCPQCDALSKPESGFLSILSNPARRALEHSGSSHWKSWRPILKKRF